MATFVPTAVVRQLAALVQSCLDSGGLGWKHVPELTVKRIIAAAELARSAAYSEGTRVSLREAAPHDGPSALPATGWDETEAHSTLVRAREQRIFPAQRDAP